MNLSAWLERRSEAYLRKVCAGAGIDLDAHPKVAELPIGQRRPRRVRDEQMEPMGGTMDRRHEHLMDHVMREETPNRTQPGRLDEVWSRWRETVQERSGMSDAHFEAVEGDARAAFEAGISAMTYAELSD